MTFTPLPDGWVSRLVARIAFIAVTLACFSTPALAEDAHPDSTESTGACIQGHSFWEVSARRLSGCPPTTVKLGELPDYTVTRCENGLWSRTTLEDLMVHNQSTKSNRLVVYVHGNWMTHPNARGRASVVFRSLVRYAREPITFVAFSWPSEKRQGFARDVLAKKSRTETDAFYLGELIQNLHSDLPTGLLGFSFGGRVMCGTLHLLGGGTLAGRCLPTAEHQTRYRLSLYAPAFDRTALTPRGQYHKALQNVDKTVNLYNSSDPILRRFKYIDTGSKPIAAGFAGIVAMPFRGDTETGQGNPLSHSGDIIQYDCCSIGRSHFELDYYSCRAMPIALKNVLGQ